MDRDTDPQVVALDREALMRGDADGEKRVAGAAGPALPEAAQADRLAVGNALRDRDLDLAAGRQGDALFHIAGDILERDGQSGLHVLALRRPRPRAALSG